MTGRVDKAKPNDLASMSDAAERPTNRAAAIKRLGADLRYDLEPDFRSLLADPVADVRSAALAVLLVYWNRSDCVEGAIEVLQQTAGGVFEAMEREDVAGHLGVYALEHPDERSRIRAALEEKVESADEEAVRRACRRALERLQP